VHVFEPEELEAIDAALVTGRPLLVRGEPGVGKSQLARAAAVALERAYVYQAADAETDAHELMWRLDLVARLGQAQLLGTPGGLTTVCTDEGRKLCLPDGEKVAIGELAPLDLRRFLSPGPLWWAFDWESAKSAAALAGPGLALALDRGCADQGVVVLIDEIDKAPSSVPNALLDALGHGGFNLPSGARVCRGEVPPLVLISANNTRPLPDAFLRRCLVLDLALPEGDVLAKHLVRRASAHFGKSNADTKLFRIAAQLLSADRRQAAEAGHYKPGLAEYLDLVRAARELGYTTEKQVAKLTRFVVNKQPPGRSR
jgi:MoxR-like ATPase